MTIPELPTTTKRRIKRIAPLQLGKMFALLYGIMGLLIIPIVLIKSFAAQQRLGIFALGAGFTIWVPVIYGAMGFIFGIIVAAIYNLAAKYIGGIEVEVE